jgi:hypothetical protein
MARGCLLDPNPDTSRPDQTWDLAVMPPGFFPQIHVYIIISSKPTSAISQEL